MGMAPSLWSGSIIVPSRVPPTCRMAHCGEAATDGELCRAHADEQAALRKRDVSWPQVAGSRLQRLAGDWKDLAACRGMPSGIFFSDRGKSHAVMDEVRAICAECPVVEDCRTEGMHEAHGVWGGLTVRQRRKLRNF